MNVLQKIGGWALALLGLVALAAGLLTPQGQEILRSLGNAVRGLASWIGDLLGRLNLGTVAGNAPVAALIGAGLFVLLMLAVPPARSSRGGVIASLLASALVAIVAYSPSLVGA